MLSALDLARQIEAGELTPRKVLDLCAEAIAAREPEIGAFVTLDLETARLRAGLSELAQLPLRGLPVGVKDIFDTADFPTEYGSPIYAGHRPKADAPIIALTRRAEGIVLGKTVTTEFATMNPAGTRNPHNLAHTPGGSSSGSAAGVAAGMFPIAFGTQTAGSVIRPASFCGVVGFKPSFRLMPAVGAKCISWSLDTVGLFAAGVADVAFAAAAIAGRDLRVDRDPLEAPTIAIARTHIWPRASGEMLATPEMQAAVEHAARRAEAAGARLRDLELPPLFEEALAAQFTIQDYEAFRSLAWEFDHHRDRISPLLRAQLETAALIELRDGYDEARRISASRAPDVCRSDDRRRGDPHAFGPRRCTGGTWDNRKPHLQSALDAARRALCQRAGYRRQSWASAWRPDCRTFRPRSRCPRRGLLPRTGACGLSPQAARGAKNMRRHTTLIAGALMSENLATAASTRQMISRHYGQEAAVAVSIALASFPSPAKCSKEGAGSCLKGSRRQLVDDTPNKPLADAAAIPISAQVIDPKTPLFRVRSFALLFTTRVASTTAVQMLAVVVGWHVYELTDSALHLGLIGLVQFPAAGHADASRGPGRRPLQSSADPALVLCGRVHLIGGPGGSSP